MLAQAGSGREGESVNGGSSSISSISGNNVVFPSVETRNLKQFNFAELKAATKGFRSDTLLGEGGFGKVYKGWLHEETLTPAKAGSGMVVAVKKLNSESVQGFREWQVSLIFHSAGFSNYSHVLCSVILVQIMLNFD